MATRAEREQERHEARVARACYRDRWDQLMGEVTRDRRELQRADKPDPAMLKRFLYNVRILQDVLLALQVHDQMGTLGAKPIPKRGQGGQFKKGAIGNQYPTWLQPHIATAIRR